MKHTLSTANGASVAIINRGATISSFLVPVSPGGKETHNIVLGFNDEQVYYDINTQYFGATIGRVANRIRNAQFELDGATVQLARNHGKHALHGGNRGFDKLDWEGPSIEKRNSREAAVYRLESADADEHYPATLQVLVAYCLSSTVVHGRLKVTLEAEYEAKIKEDSPSSSTAIGLANHAYWNVSKGPSIEGTEVTLPSTQYVEIDEEKIPTGKIGTFPGLTPNKPIKIGSTEPFIDNCFVVNTDPASVELDSRGGPQRLLVRQYSPDTSLTLEVSSTEPAVQIFTGDAINIPAKGDRKGFSKRAGLAIEPQRYIDAINHDAWKHMMILKKGETYGSKSSYTVWTQA